MSNNMSANIVNGIVMPASDFCYFVFCLSVSVGSDDSSDSDFEKSEESSEESGISEELSESENEGKRRKTRWEERT